MNICQTFYIKSSCANEFTVELIINKLDPTKIWAYYSFPKNFLRAGCKCSEHVAEDVLSIKLSNWHWGNFTYCFCTFELICDSYVCMNYPQFPKCWYIYCYWIFVFFLWGGGCSLRLHKVYMSVSSYALIQESLLTSFVISFSCLRDI